ncbi:MAG: helix-turn-helix domain-containing protein [Planctomycetes bacterium]|nr:helix-turn-helix domain-containing protein [Planctomycetota bacterium]
MPWKDTCPMKERSRFVVEYDCGEHAMAALCRMYGISRRTGYKWVARYEAGGPPGLADRSRAPHRHANGVAPEIEAAVLQARADHPTWGPRKLRVWLEGRWRRGSAGRTSANRSKAAHPRAARRDDIEREKPMSAHAIVSPIRLARALLLLCAVVTAWPVPREAASAETVTPFPAKIPMSKPTDRPISAAVARLYDQWNPHEDRANELFSNFKFSPLEGFGAEGNVSRRDPSKVLKIDGTYYVWYTHRRTEAPPSGPKNATDTVPSFDWDLAEIWYATSQDGFTWVERGPAVARLPKPQYGWRSVSTPDVLAWGGKYYLYYQGFNEIPGLRGDRAAATVAEADSPDGPWRPLGKVVVDFGAPDEWDAAAIHDPYPLVYRGRIHLYYKGSPGKGGRDGTLVRAQGLAIADHPLGPFTKSPLNPVINSGHETCMWPWKGGIAAIASLDGPEKNTVQFAPDGENFRVVSRIQVPPIAPGPFVPDAFADNGDGRGFTWGLCHINPDGGGATSESILIRFDCDLSLDVDRPSFKPNNLRFEASTYFQSGVQLPDNVRGQIDREREKVDRNTILIP